MKTVLLIIAATLTLLFGTKEEQHSDSWMNYCEKYVVDPDHPDPEQVNNYYDWYVGSAEEEEDLDIMCNN